MYSKDSRITILSLPINASSCLEFLIVRILVHICIITLLLKLTIIFIIRFFYVYVHYFRCQVFPTAKLKWCSFHWAQAIQQFVQEMSFSQTYRKRGNDCTLISKHLALPFLPGEHINSAFTRLRKQADSF